MNIDWIEICSQVKAVVNSTISYIGGVTVVASVVIGTAKLFGAKWVDMLFERIIIKHKHKFDKDLALKSAQFSVLLPEQMEIAKELYSKIRELQRSTKLTIEFYNVAKEQIKKNTNDENKIEDIEYEFIPVFETKGNKPKTGRIFTCDEIVTISNYKQLQNEVKEYIEQKAIFMPEDIMNNINAVLFMTEMFLHLNLPKECVQHVVSGVLDKEDSRAFVDEFESMKNDINFNDDRVVDIIDGLFIAIQNQFRSLLGVQK